MLTNVDKIRDYLKTNRDVAVDVARELNCWDGSYPQFDVWDLTELTQCMCGDYKSTQNFVDVLLNSLDTLNNSDEYVRFDDYGTYLESISEEDLQEEVLDYIDDLISGLEEHYPHHVTVWDDELKLLLEDEEQA